MEAETPQEFDYIFLPRQIFFYNPFSAFLNYVQGNSPNSHERTIVIEYSMKSLVIGFYFAG
jgi:hypothetical protein